MSAWYCIDIVRRNSVSVTQGSKRVITLTQVSVVFCLKFQSVFYFPLNEPVVIMSSSVTEWNFRNSKPWHSTENKACRWQPKWITGFFLFFFFFFLCVWRVRGGLFVLITYDLQMSKWYCQLHASIKWILVRFCESNLSI